jgi:excisionase family DNA binding protein
MTTTTVGLAMLDTGMVTIPRAIAETGLSRSTLYRLMRDRELAYVKVRGRRLIPRAALADLLERQLVPATA